MHLTLFPYSDGGRAEDQATQHSVKELLSVGIQPDILLCRASREIPQASARKSRFSAMSR